jgi:hypothetical protein
MTSLRHGQLRIFEHLIHVFVSGETSHLTLQSTVNNIRYSRLMLFWYMYFNVCFTTSISHTKQGGFPISVHQLLNINELWCKLIVLHNWYRCLWDLSTGRAHNWFISRCEWSEWSKWSKRVTKRTRIPFCNKNETWAIDYMYQPRYVRPAD